jgi:acyl carrier protein
VTERLHRLVADILDVPPADVTEQTGARAVAPWSSLQHLRIVAAIEHVHGIRLSPAEIRTARTVADFRTLLRQRGITA